MDIKKFFTKNWIHFVAIAIMLILCGSYFSLQFNGYGLKQHDIEQFKGMSNEIVDYRERTGEEAQWTNSMFGGMPATQISIHYEGNYAKSIMNSFFGFFKIPAGIVFLYMLGFYIFAMCLKMNRWVAILGAIAFGFTTYDIIILQAGHNTKAYAAIFLAPLLGAFIMAYQRNLMWGVILSGVFMVFELASNHLQITYYFAFVLMSVGLVFLIQAIQTKKIKNFLLASGGVLAMYGLAILINWGNISLTAEYAKHTTRGGNDLTISADGTSNAQNVTEGLERDYVTQWSYGIGETFTLVSPYVKGGGSVALGASPFKEQVEDLDIPSDKLNGAMNFPVYWGEQPITSGPVYVGVIVCLLAFLGMFFLKNPIKWALLAMVILTVMLSWGKNFMGLTDFFLDYVPGYNKFRAVTIILLITGVIIPIIGCLFLDLFVKEREQLKAQKNKFYYVAGAFIIFLVLVKFIGLGDGYTSESDKRQLAGIESQIASLKNNIRAQILAEDPATLQAKFNVDVNNSGQVEAFVDMQAAQYAPTIDLESIKEIRASIFDASMNRSIIFAVLAAGILALLLTTSIQAELLVIGLAVLVAIDLIGVSYNYLGKQFEDEREDSYKYWTELSSTMYPEFASEADEQIMAMELAENSSLEKVIATAKKEAGNKAEELGFETKDQFKRVEDLYRFQALNRNTNYRVFDVNGNFNSARASYFHKSLGGYHGAKLRSIQNLIEFHLLKSNNKVYDMLNVKYFIQNGADNKLVANKNQTALGNAWFVRSVRQATSADEEILNLGNRFHLKAKSVGQLVVNGNVVDETSVFGSEKLQYVIKNDTIDVPLSNGLRKGMEAVLVMDINGKTDYILKQMLDADTTKSFLQLLELNLEEEFEPRNSAVMRKESVAKLSKQTFTADGTITMKSYAPNKISYTAQTNTQQLAVFSEIYYADGWKAFVNGKETPILKANYLLRALEIPAGTSNVEFVFDQPSLHSSNLFAKIGCILIIGLVIGGIFVDRKRKLANSETNKA